MNNQIRAANVGDINAIVALSETKRLRYQAYQPLFWRKSADSAVKQKPFIQNQIVQEHILALVHETEERIAGFVIADISRGKQCNIDDFALADERDWDTIGKALLLEVGQLAKTMGSLEYVIVCGHLDQPKRNMLHSVGLHVYRYWYTKAIGPFDKQAQTMHIRRATSRDRDAIAMFLKRSDMQVPELENEGIDVIVAINGNAICGCLMALTVPAPPVYDPGGATCLVTELSIAKSDDQSMICQALLHAAGASAQKKRAVQYVVICDSNNQHIQNHLSKYGMTIASEWYQGRI